MLMRYASSILIVASVSTLAFAEPPEGDVHITVENNTLTIGLIAEDESFTVAGTRVFYGPLGLDVPNVGEDPGFKALAGTFSPGGFAGFDILGSLQKWDGAAFTTGQSETMTVSFGPASVTTPILNAFTAGFDIAVDPDGSWHHHPFFELNGPASDGVYLIPLQLRKDGFGTSLPVWILWGQNADEATADAAYAAASATIPNPGTLAPLAVAALAVRRRRPR